MKSEYRFTRGSLGWFSTCLFALAIGASEAAAAEQDQGATAEKVTAQAEKPKSRLEQFAQMSMEQLADITKKGKETLDRVIKGDESNLDRSMRELQEVVCAAMERARRLSEWDVESIKAEAEKAFDNTMAAIAAYLELVKDDGIVHQASKRIRSAALDNERLFREKADAKNGVFSERYRELGAAMHAQAERAAAAWEAIRKERKNAENALTELKEYRGLYVDVKKALGIGAAVKELEAVRDDLIELSEAMRKVQQAVLEEAKSAAEDLSKKE